ncbi:hypothetical protein [European catfish virus]|uniref:Uncharacterized protein n=1 Tax=European catfish virus TaxID=84739 RepID=I2BFS2_9VIRU|nr:hypothetical protein A190_gp092 [European catfish virus]AFJ52375.1 hypothetical protein [European catfish virus]AMZ04921.1 hypothetical protein [European catfish virus]AMZ05057.1 hypothetical protein [European catfish virus]
MSIGIAQCLNPERIRRIEGCKSSERVQTIDVALHLKKNLKIS